MFRAPAAFGAARHGAHPANRRPMPAEGSVRTPECSRSLQIEGLCCGPRSTARKPR